MSTHLASKASWPRAAAVALGRWGLGMIFFFFGLGKLADVGGFARHLASQFEKTWLPPVLLSLFGHLLPFLEVTFGLLLVLGLFRNATLLATGLLLSVLTFGQVLLGQPQVVFFNLSYVMMTAVVLFAAPYDRWVLYPRAPTSRVEEVSA